MTLKRRDFLLFLGTSAGAIAFDGINQTKFSMPFMSEAVNTDNAAVAANSSSLSFKPLRGVMPLVSDKVPTELQAKAYSKFEVKDDLVLPEGFTYDIVAAWGDKVGDSRFGYNNDHISFVETGKNEGYLTVNFEYISPIPWTQTFEQVIGKTLPLAAIETSLKQAGKEGIDVFALPDGDATKQAIVDVAKEMMIDVGIGVISVKRDTEGKWVRTYSPADRRITGISGLEDGRYLKSTGPAVAIFKKANAKGYKDKLGDRIIGTVNNCSGGTTPWGTMFSAEENFQVFVPEPVYADGSSFAPKKKTFSMNDEDAEGLGSIFGLAGNKYGWMVEVDPANPNDFGTKHTWLGRYRHEAVAIRAEVGQPLVIYSGCDRRGGHLYKFVSKGIVRNPKDKNNSKLLSDGMLYAAKLNADGTGRWIALKPDTPVNPELPSVHAGKMIPLPKRPDGGIFKATKDEEITAFKQQFKTLGDLYEGNALEKQGAILIDAHYAANAAGATCNARPEDSDIAPDGSLVMTLTSGSFSGDGGPDLRVFKGPDGKAYEYGWVMKLVETKNEPAAMSFNWAIIATGGEPADGGQGFSNPDNLAFDNDGNLWMVSDISSDKLNKALSKGRIDPKENKPVSQSNVRGIFGNNSIWFMPSSGANAGQAFLFGYGPMECETTGPFFTADQQTLFLSVQHPGEVNGMRKDMAAKTREYAMRTTDGKEFMQTRKVPIGSNWPGKGPNDPPKPALVAIRTVGKVQRLP